MKKKILFAALLVVAIACAFIIKAGVETARNAVLVKNLLKKVATSQGGIQSYPPLPRTLEITDEEVNAGLNLLCNANQLVSIGQKLNLFTAENLPINPTLAALPCQFFNNFKIKFGTGDYSATARLLRPAEGNVSVKGKIAVAGKRNIEVTFEEVYLDGQKAPTETISLLENTANQELNRILDQMKTVSFESVEISPGKITIKGIFSLDELLCIFGVSGYCTLIKTF